MQYLIWYLMQIKIVNRFINDLHKCLPFLFLKRFSAQKIIFYHPTPTPTIKHTHESVWAGSVYGSELLSCEWLDQDAAATAFIYSYN